MPALEYFAVCESMSVDRATNRVSLFNIYDIIHREEEEFGEGRPVSKMVAVACFNKEDGDEDRDFQATLKVDGPGVEPLQYTLNFQMTGARQRLSFYIQGIPANEPGQIEFELLVNNEHTAKHTVDIESEE